MAYKHTAGYQRGESPSNAGRPTNTHTHPHTRARTHTQIMKTPNIRRKEHTSLIHVRSTSITIPILIVIAQREKKETFC